MDTGFPMAFFPMNFLDTELDPAWFLHTNNDGKIHHVTAGKIHYFDWAIFQFANCKRLPEGSDHGE